MGAVRRYLSTSAPRWGFTGVRVVVRSVTELAFVSHARLTAQIVLLEWEVSAVDDCGWPETSVASFAQQLHFRRYSC